MLLTMAGADAAAERRMRTALFALWSIAVAFLVWRHVPWRDEVRALSMALRGNGLAAMFHAVRGEGHPALWYVMLRAAHGVLPLPGVLHGVALAVGGGAVALLVFRAPFRLPILAMIAFGAFALFEYTVTARNYGISMLILFALAHRYPIDRDRGVVLGALLFLLCNTNVHSVVLTAGFLLFWLVELLAEDGLAWTPRLRGWAIAAALAAAGVALCLVTVYPPANDAAVMARPDHSPSYLIQTFAQPGVAFAGLLPDGWADNRVAILFVSVALLGSLFGLVRSPGAFLAAAFVLPSFLVLFRFVYPGGLRHEALFLVFLIVLYWLVAQGRGGAWPTRVRIGRLDRVAAVGRALFAGLLLIQFAAGMDILAANLRGDVFSRSRDLGAILSRAPLRRATVIGDPEYLLETVPYYADNPVYLMRERRYGRYVVFTRHARTTLSLADILADARMLRARTNEAVVIVLEHRIDPAQPPRQLDEGYNWILATTPGQVRAFLAATCRVARFDPGTREEGFDVYVLDGPGTRICGDPASAERARRPPA